MACVLPDHEFVLVRISRDASGRVDFDRVVQRARVVILVAGHLRPARRLRGDRLLVLCVRVVRHRGWIVVAGGIHKTLLGIGFGTRVCRCTTNRGCFPNERCSGDTLRLGYFRRRRPNFGLCRGGRHFLFGPGGQPDEPDRTDQLFRCRGGLLRDALQLRLRLGTRLRRKNSSCRAPEPIARQGRETGGFGLHHERNQGCAICQFRQ
mmetsp:Transcript_93162/g.268097  ORF Transcript_93162/g.268097 Transcript_93162/m.268097 type:complete len:207 (+) Transcript_93162:295-915(+)